MSNIRFNAYHAHMRTLEQRLRAGCDPDERDMAGRTPLHYARDVAPMELLLNYGANVLALSDNGQTTLFHDKTTEAMEFLIRSGVDVNARDEFGCSAIVYCKATEQMVILLRHGADVTLRNAKGKTLEDVLRTEWGGTRWVPFEEARTLVLQERLEVNLPQAQSVTRQTPKRKLRL